MPDISMCRAKDCPKSKMCKRHQDSGTKPDEYWQTYMQYDPDTCESYWPVGSDKRSTQ